MKKLNGFHCIGYAVPGIVVFLICAFQNELSGGGGTKEMPVGTSWLACGTPDKVRTMMVSEDFGRDINLAIATNKAMQMFCEMLNEEGHGKVENEPESSIFGQK